LQLHPFLLSEEEHQWIHQDSLLASHLLCCDMWYQLCDQLHGLEDNCMFGCVQICPHYQSVQFETWVNPERKEKGRTNWQSLQRDLISSTCSDRSFDRLLWSLSLSISYSFAHSTLRALALFWAEMWRQK
jgi:hypothetical protein